MPAMTVSEGLCPRALRAAVFAAACVLVSAATYAVAGHGTAPLWAVLIALAAVYPLAWAAGGRVRGGAAICALAALVQLGLDYWFSLAQINADAVRGCGIIQALPPMGETIRCAHSASVAPVQAPDGSVHVSMALLLVQLLVALIAALPLALGEHAQAALRHMPALREACARIWPAVSLALVRLAVPQDGAVAAPVRETRRVRPARPALRHAVVRRGPPAVPAAG